MQEPKVYYKCDPNKNTKCPRTNCKIKPIVPCMPGPCDCTTHLEYAKQPVEAVQLIFSMSKAEAAELAQNDVDEEGDENDV